MDIDKYIQKENRMENIQDIIALEDYKILMQYLALGNTITIPDTISDIEINMSKEYTIEATYLEFNNMKYVYLDIDELVRGVAPSIYTKELTVCDIINNLIPKLKLEEPLHKCGTHYKNRWEEIKYITQKEINHIILKS